MDDSLLVPVDGSEAATGALEHALEIAADTGATVHALHVASGSDPNGGESDDRDVDVRDEGGEEIVARARSLAADRNVPVTDRVIGGEPREAIPEYAETHGVDLVIMGAHGRRGLGEYILGTTTESVVNRSPVPVMTVRAGDDVRRTYPYRDVLVPTDDSEHARAALQLASRIAERHDATVHLLFVVDELPETVDPRSDRLSADDEREADEVLADAASGAGLGEENVVTAVEAGSVSHEITAYADANDVDLVVMGTHGWSELDRILLGSFTERVIRTAPVPVLTTAVRE
ncbi:universal stress protein [Natrialbaceae archaeon GCM10025810]|uniref:universal stress protein n=1 Tax=Halovalidus salilacus TaxID=3075124 RepID=UPI00360D63E4